MNEINYDEFNERTGHAYARGAPGNIAEEHCAEAKGRFLGVVVRDWADGDFGWVLLGRDAKGQFRAIDMAASLPTLEQARGGLEAAMTTTAGDLFPQDAVQ
jgi:hypothetical protein